mgnify:FL=1
MKESAVSLFDNSRNKTPAGTAAKDHTELNTPLDSSILLDKNNEQWTRNNNNEKKEREKFEKDKYNVARRNGKLQSIAAFGMTEVNVNHLICYSPLHIYVLLSQLFQTYYTHIH